LNPPPSVEHIQRDCVSRFVMIGARVFFVVLVLCALAVVPAQVSAGVCGSTNPDGNFLCSALCTSIEEEAAVAGGLLEQVGQLTRERDAALEGTLRAQQQWEEVVAKLEVVEAQNRVCQQDCLLQLLYGDEWYMFYLPIFLSALICVCVIWINWCDNEGMDVNTKEGVNVLTALQRENKYLRRELQSISDAGKQYAASGADGGGGEAKASQQQTCPSPSDQSSTIPADTQQLFAAIDELLKRNEEYNSEIERTFIDQQQQHNDLFQTFTARAKDELDGVYAQVHSSQPASEQ
jgi:hypothetical protein